MAKWIVARTIRRGTSYIVAGTILDDAPAPFNKRVLDYTFGTSLVVV